MSEENDDNEANEDDELDDDELDDDELDDDADDDADDDIVDVEMSLEAKLLSNLHHQMETFHNDSLKYWAFQSKKNEKLNMKIQEMTEVLKVIQKLPESNEVSMFPLVGNLPSFGQQLWIVNITPFQDLPHLHQRLQHLCQKKCQFKLKHNK